MVLSVLYEVLTQRSCRWSIRNIVALTEKGADYVLVDVGGPGGADRADWYRPLNPYGRTPALRHGAVIVVESQLINEYIDETAAGRTLMPATPAARAWARAWIGHNDNTLMPRLTRLAKAATDHVRAQALADIRSELALAESRAFEHSSPGGPFWGGKVLGLVDIGWWTFFNALQLTLAQSPMDDALSAHPRLAAWCDALFGHPAFAHATRLLDALKPQQVLRPGNSPAKATL